jgi:hypothetical protein
MSISFEIQPKVNRAHRLLIYLSLQENLAIMQKTIPNS